MLATTLTYSKLGVVSGAHQNLSIAYAFLLFDNRSYSPCSLLRIAAEGKTKLTWLISTGSTLETRAVYTN